MASVLSERGPNPNNRDPYYDEVLSTATVPLIVVGDKTQTKTNLVKEDDRLSRLIAQQSRSIPLTKACSKLLEEARGLMATDPVNPGAVLGKFEEVKQLLLRAHESRKAWKWWGSGLLIGNCVCLAIVATIVSWKALIPGQAALESSLNAFLACALWGVMGGVVDALFALHTHFANQRFDLRYRAWYILHPILGLSLGAVVFLVIQAGLLVVSGAALKEGTAGAGLVGATTFPIVVAFLAGFKQSTMYEFLSRVVRSIFQSE
ncbi:MAG: hypothetical protein HWN68_19050 [Desulfobacterales bacterium]|nr:hypothetical protein [Desulfobacterales bacterium]